ncbi:hypothetical protein ACFWF7_09950 [Nocardia sp. NPDC060256]|uniref:hypothetical protein n=1 Tax=unclassified Nocardia TaxID=2637762 RepID=UPI003654671D
MTRRSVGGTPRVEFRDPAAAHSRFDAPEFQELEALQRSGASADASFFEGEPPELRSSEQP